MFLQRTVEDRDAGFQRGCVLILSPMFVILRCMSWEAKVRKTVTKLA